MGKSKAAPGDTAEFVKVSFELNILNILGIVESFESCYSSLPMFDPFDRVVGGRKRFGT